MLRIPKFLAHFGSIFMSSLNFIQRKFRLKSGILYFNGEPSSIMTNSIISSNSDYIILIAIKMHNITKLYIKAIFSCKVREGLIGSFIFILLKFGLSSLLSLASHR